MAEAKATPNKDIDKALKRLMKALDPKKGASEEDSAGLAPDEIKAHVAVVATAIKWEQVKHNMKDNDEFNPESI